MEYYSAFKSICVHPHHVKQNVCGSRAKYRDGKKETAVKVYTVNQESVYILISNVSAVGGSEELQALCDQYGVVEEFRVLDDYPSEEFTETYLVKYDSFPSARVAKKHLDDKSFLGSSLHVFYAPEFETVYETSLKLQERRKYISWKTKKGSSAVPPTDQNATKAESKCKKLSTVGQNVAVQPVTYVWAGKEYTVYPSAAAVQEPVSVNTEKQKLSSNLFVPRQLKQTDANSSNNYEAKDLYSTNANLKHVDESSYLNTMSHVRTKISNVSVPNVRVSLKRKRRL